jgi:predicted RNA-binding Zn ribbon-like protein
VSNRPPANFIADSLGLDFLNSIATPVDTPVDWLDDGDGLVDWLAQAGLVPTDALEALRTRATPGALDEVAGQARALRECCTLIFADHTRRRARRWCSMAICGNRAKQAAHRNRLKSRRSEASPP